MPRDRGARPERAVSQDPAVAKVYFGLAKAGITGQLAIDAVSCMMAEGVIFEMALTGAAKATAEFGEAMEKLNG
jgi:hypothetical protein